MRTLRVIGIGTGNPEHLTLQAVRALADVDAVFALDKGAEKADLLALRRAICAEHIRKPYRFVAAEDPPRDRRPADYGGTVEAWHAARAELLERLIRDNLGAGEVGPSWSGGTLPSTTAPCASWSASGPAAPCPSPARWCPASPACRR